MKPRHCALVIEDDDETFLTLERKLKALGHDVIRAKTREEAVVRLREGGFCYVLLDMQLPAEEGDIPLVTTGLMILKDDIRNMDHGVFPGRNPATDKRYMQVIVITGYADGDVHEFGVLAMQEGADDFIRKPLPSDLVFADKISRCLRHGGRANHTDCEAMNAAAARRSVPPPPPTTKQSAPAPPETSAKPTKAPRLRVTAQQKRRRTAIVVNDHELLVQDEHFILLLRLLVEDRRSPEAWRHRHDLGGARGDWRAAPRLNKAVAKELPDCEPLVESDVRGCYRLNPNVIVEAVDVRALARHSHEAVQRLAKALSEKKA